MCMGIILIAVGLFFPIPSEKLTISNTNATKYGDTLVEEYVGGDAYNYTITASIVAGKISGVIALKAVFATMGCLILCIGLISYSLNEEDKPDSDMQIKDKPIEVLSSSDDIIPDETVTNTDVI